MSEDCYDVDKQIIRVNSLMETFHKEDIEMLKAELEYWRGYARGLQFAVEELSRNKHD